MNKIDELRFREDFHQLSQFGATDDGGVDRPTFSDAHLDARRWYLKRATDAGLQVAVDGAGNHSAILEQPGADKTFLIGSHLDSVPDGGRYDGALGVVAALEVLRTLKDSGIKTAYHLEAIDFTDEESQLIECLGSRALIGDISEYDLQNPPCGRERFKVALKRAELTHHSVLASRRPPDSLAGYLELHIEQGSKLVDEEVQVGVVTGIVGIRTFLLSFLGRRDHAGTTSMANRLNAGKGASAFLLSIMELVVDQYPNCVANIGRMQFFPGVTCIVPERVDVDLEFRGPDETKLDELENTLIAQANDDASRHGLSLDVIPLNRNLSAFMDPRIQQAIHRSAKSLSLSYLDMPSGAGHDAQLLARITPAGMIFVPSTGGSHNPGENARWEDCVNGANLLLHTILDIAKQ